MAKRRSNRAGPSPAWRPEPVSVGPLLAGEHRLLAGRALGVGRALLVYVLRAVGVLIAGAAPVLPLIDLQMGGWLGVLGDVATNLVAGVLLLVAAEVLGNARTGARTRRISKESAEE